MAMDYVIKIAGEGRDLGEDIKGQQNHNKGVPALVHAYLDLPLRSPCSHRLAASYQS